MIKFHGFIFYSLLLVVIPFFQFFQTEKNRKNLLFLINLAFVLLLSALDLPHVFFLAFLALAEYFGIWTLSRLKDGMIKSLFTTLLILLTACILSFYKYHLFRNSILFIFPELSTWSISISFLGLSFLVLRWIHLIVDTASGALTKMDFRSYFTYVFFFPCLVAGPVHRFQQFQDDLNRYEPLTQAEQMEAINRIVTGGFKKTVLANPLLKLSLSNINAEDLIRLNRFQLIISLLIYTLALYFDFSGYSDIAIGIGRLFSIRIPENFNRPFAASNIRDFWRRWHITFMEWLIDYIYYPTGRLLNSMGINNQFPTTVLCVFCTFMFAAIWHGDGTHFIYYGLYLSSGILIHVFWRKLLVNRLSKESLSQFDHSKIAHFLGIALTLAYMNIAWLFYLDRMSGLKVLLGIR